jgi:hypothetical protein
MVLISRAWPRARGASCPSPAGLAPLTERIDGELHQHAKADPRVKALMGAADRVDLRLPARSLTG